MTKNHIAGNLAYLCRLRAVAPSTLAEHLGFYGSTFTRLMDPSKNIVPRAKTLKKLSEFFNVPVTSLLDEDLSAQLNPETEAKPDAVTLIPTRKLGKVPLIVIKDAEGLTMEQLFSHDCLEKAACGDESPFRVEDWVVAPPGLTADNCRAFAIHGNAMSPTLNDGDIVFLKADTYRVGDVVLGATTVGENEVAVVRRYAADDTGEEWLTADATALPGIRVRPCRGVLGKVVSLYREL